MRRLLLVGVAVVAGVVVVIALGVFITTGSDGAVGRLNVLVEGDAPSATPIDRLRNRVRQVVEASLGTLISFNIAAPGKQRDTVDVEWRAPSGFVAARIWTDARDVLRAIHESGLAEGGLIWMRVQLPAKDTYGAERFRDEQEKQTRKAKAPSTPRPSSGTSVTVN